MKKSLYIVAAVFMLLVQGCVMYSDKDEIENAQVDVSDLMYFNYVSPVISMAELADFFDRYQDIRTDRDQAEALARSYFGEYFNPENLFYEEFSVHPYWGKIAVTETDGQYLVYPLRTFSGIIKDILFQKRHLDTQRQQMLAQLIMDFACDTLAALRETLCEIFSGAEQ